MDVGDKTGDHIYTGYFALVDNELKAHISEADGFNELGLDYLLTKENLEDDVGDSHYEFATAQIFLMGSCDLFAWALNEKYGYTLCQIEKGQSCHYFCITECEDIDGQKWYPLIDIRGITTDFFKFRATSCVESATKDDIRKMIISNDGLASDVVGIEYARRIIAKHPEFYDVRYCGLIPFFSTAEEEFLTGELRS